MKRALTITFGIALVMAIAVVLFNASSVHARPSAQATSTPTTAMASADAAAKYCADKGGTVTTRYPTYNTNAPQTQWLKLAGSRDFCTFLSQPDSSGFQSHIEIALDTLYADQPTLAVLAYLEPVALPPFTGANPATLYCQKLGGTDIWGGENNAAGGGWVTDAPDSATNFQVVGMCMFPDGSAIDSWGLTYKANGVVRGTDLTKVVRYQPSQLPNVFTGGASANQAGVGDVDKTLTQADNGSKVTLKVGDVLEVTLDSNPSTGYSWQVKANDRNVLLPLGEPQFTLGNPTPMPGAGGTETFQFKALAKGQTTLTLVYLRPWETNVTPTPNDTFTLSVTVE
jgi:predicted secreted protein/putative hemolysin